MMIETEDQIAAARLEGVKLTTRELVHRLNNDLALSVGILELLRQQPDLPPGVREMLDQMAESLDVAVEHIAKFRDVVRVETKDTPVGPALDLDRSTRADGRR